MSRIIHIVLLESYQYSSFKFFYLNKLYEVKYELGVICYKNESQPVIWSKKQENFQINDLEKFARCV